MLATTDPAAPTTPTAPTTPAAALSSTVPPSVAPPPSARPKLQLLAPILWFLSGILALASAALPWWTASGNGTTLNFLPGSMFSASVDGGSLSEQYAQLQLGPVGGLYIAILVLLLIGGISALLGGVLSILRPYYPTRIRPGWVLAFALTLLVLAIGAVAAAPGIQPWALRDSSSGVCSRTELCGSYWGSSNGVSWGAAAGWYVAIAALVLGIVALVVIRRAAAPLSEAAVTVPPMA